MESTCDLPGLAVLLLALGAACSAKPTCPDKADVTCDAGAFYHAAKCACEGCPDGFFSSRYGVRAPSCNPCKLCEGVFRVKVPCSRTQDAQCECRAGLRCIDKECSSCDRNCEGGEEPAETGCRKCPPETFNNETNGACKPWTNCDSKGLRVLVLGSSTTDTTCTIPTVANVEVVEAGGNLISYQVIIAVVVFLVMCVVCPTMIMVAWVKKKVKNGFKKIPAQIVKTAQAEDACSCHFPEEEQGDTATHMLPQP